MTDKTKSTAMATTSQSQSRSLNPFEGERQSRVATVGGAVEVQRAVAEVQAAIMLAKQFPRDKLDCTDRILTECTRASLAESAIYSYPKGGQEVTGPSIRLAEVLAMNWGNFQFGWDELGRKDGTSEIRAWAWDCETNVRRETRFTVRHWRDTKSGGYAIKDERDIYELCANQAARRMRACVLNIIPGDVIEAAVQQCERTLQQNEAVTPDKIKALLSAFEAYGVSKGQIEKRLGRKVDALNGAAMAQLRKIYNGIKDGMAKVEEFFEPDSSTNAPTPSAEKKPENVAEPAAVDTASPPDDWDAAVDNLLQGVADAATLADLDAFIDENGTTITALSKSKNNRAVKKWAVTVSERKKVLAGTVTA